MVIDFPIDHKLKELDRLFIIGFAETIKEAFNYLVILTFVIVEFRQEIIRIHMGVFP
mgnify:FL=1